MKLRAILLTVLLGGALTYFQYENARGRFHEAEQWFLDFLVANARDTFTRNQPAHSDDVVIVEFREEDKAEFSAWPPAPLDYILALKQLAPHEPEVVVFTTPMKWSGEQSQFVKALRELLVPVPSVVFAFDISMETNKSNADEADFFASNVPSFGGSEGGGNPAQHFASVSALPDKALLPAAHFGFSVAPVNGALPMVATDGKRLVPSVTAQALTLFRHAPYSEQRLRFGNGARLSLGERFIVPLDESGALHLNEKLDVPKINALELMTPDLGDETGKQISDLLGKQKAVVFTISSTPAGSAQARALAQALSLPEVRRLSGGVVWCSAGAACLLGFLQLRRRRFGALVFGFALIVGVLLVSLLVFQSALLWWPPFAALSVAVTSTVFCFLFPNSVNIKNDAASLADL